MENVTILERRKELRVLLNKMRDHPERDWSTERDRVAILNRMIGGSRH